MRRILGGLMAVLAIVALAGPALAGADKVYVCHAAGRDGTTHFITLHVPANDGGFPQGHFTEGGAVEAGHEDDYLGQCLPEVTPSATVTPTPVPTPEPTPTVEPSPTPTVTPEPSPTPTFTPSPTPSVEPTLTPTPTVEPTPTPTTSPSLTPEPIQSSTPPQLFTLPPTDTEASTSSNSTDLGLVLLLVLSGITGWYLMGRRLRT